MESVFSLRTLKQERLHIRHIYQTVCLCVGILHAVMSVRSEESVYPFVYPLFLCYAVLLELFMQELLREIILQPELYCNYGDERLLFRDTKAK